MTPLASGNNVPNFFVYLQRRGKIMRNRLSWFLVAALFFVVGLGSRADAVFIYFVVAEGGSR